MIFYLEIEGQLKKCLVREPFSQNLHHWNMIRTSAGRDSEAWDLCTRQIKSIASQAVDAGAYEVCD